MNERHESNGSNERHEIHEREDAAMCIIKHGYLSNVTGNTHASIDNMRKFHNWIKLNLIQMAVSICGNDTLLDLSVGRGGDLNKWVTAGINTVTGIDIDRNSIFSSIRNGDNFDGAIARLRNMRIRKPYVKFSALSVLDPEAVSYTHLTLPTKRIV